MSNPWKSPIRNIKWTTPFNNENTESPLLPLFTLDDLSAFCENTETDVKDVQYDIRVEDKVIAIRSIKGNQYKLRAGEFETGWEEKLKDGAWLSTDVMRGYMIMLQQMVGDMPIIMLDNILLNILAARNMGIHELLQFRDNKVEMSSQYTVYILWGDNTHWYVYEVELPSKTIRCIDSLYSGRIDVPDAIQTMFGTPTTAERYRAAGLVQDDGFDCGIYALSYVRNSVASKCDGLRPLMDLKLSRVMIKEEIRDAKILQPKHVGVNLSSSYPVPDKILIDMIHNEIYETTVYSSDNHDDYDIVLVEQKETSDRPELYLQKAGEGPRVVNVGVPEDGMEYTQVRYLYDLMPGTDFTNDEIHDFADVDIDFYMKTLLDSPAKDSNKRKNWANNCILYATNIQDQTIVNTIDNECVFGIGSDVQFKRTSHIWMSLNTKGEKPSSHAFDGSNCSHVPETYMALLKDGNDAQIPAYTIPWNIHERDDYSTLENTIRVKDDEKLLLLLRGKTKKPATYSIEERRLVDKKGKPIENVIIVIHQIRCVSFFTRLQSYMKTHPCPTDSTSIVTDTTKFARINTSIRSLGLADNLMLRSKDNKHYSQEDYQQALDIKLKDHEGDLPSLLSKYKDNITLIDVTLPILLPVKFIPHISWYKYYTKYNRRAVPGWQLVYTNDLTIEDEYMLYYLYNNVKIGYKDHTFTLDKNNYYACSVRHS